MMQRRSVLKLTAIALTAATMLSAAPRVMADAAKLDKVLAGDHRNDANKARDKFRNPKATLDFFGVKPTSTVVEVWPGGGWYTEVLSPYLRDGGSYIALFPSTATRGLKNFEDKLATRPELYNKTKIAKIAAPSTPDANATLDGIAPNSVDTVLTFRNVHNWVNPDWTDAYMKALFEMLKPGGVLGVVDHRAKAGTNVKTMIDSGYITEDFVIRRALAAGFKLDAKSEVNANAKDTKDYPKGVWTLPPVLTEGDKDREKFLAIGESDRMTLRFVKPAK
jgi:predicted methyltransferase